MIKKFIIEYFELGSWSKLSGDFETLEECNKIIKDIRATDNLPHNFPFRIVEETITRTVISQ